MAKDSKNKRAYAPQQGSPDAKKTSKKKNATATTATVVCNFLVAFFEDDNTGSNQHVNNAPTNCVNNLFQRMIAPIGTSALIYPHSAQASVDANLNPNLPPADINEPYGLDGQFDTSAIKMVCNNIIGANDLCRFVQTDNHNAALNSFASIFIIREIGQLDPTQWKDKFVAVKRITIGNNINLALVLDGGNPNPSVRVVVNPTTHNLTADVLTGQFGDLGPGQHCLVLEQPPHAQPAIHPNPLRHNPSLFTYCLNSLDPIHPHRHFKLVRICSDDTAQVVDAPSTDEELHSVFPSTDVSLEIGH